MAPLTLYQSWADQRLLLKLKAVQTEHGMWGSASKQALPVPVSPLISISYLIHMTNNSVIERSIIEDRQGVRT